MTEPGIVIPPQPGWWVRTEKVGVNTSGAYGWVADATGYALRDGTASGAYGWSTVDAIGKKPIPVFDAVGAGATGSGTGKTVSWAHTITGNCVVTAVHHGDQAATTSTALVGTTSMTQLGSFQYVTAGGNHFYVDLFGLIGGPTGAQTLSASISNGTDFVAADSISFNRVASFGTVQTNSGNGTSLSQTVTAASNQMVVQMFGNGSGASQGTMTVASYNQTEVWYAAGGSNNYGMMLGYAPGSSSVSFTVNGSNDNWGAIAVPLIP